MAILLAMAAPTVVRAAEFQSGDSYVLPAGKVISEDLFVAASSVEILGEVEGDLFVSANIVEIKGNVTGNTFIMANYSAVHGHVGGDVMALVNQLWIDGTVGQDVRALAGGQSAAMGPAAEFASNFGSAPTVFSEGLAVSAEAQIGGDVHAFVGGPALIAGTVGRDLSLHGGEAVTFTGSVARDANVGSAATVILSPAPKVGGEFTYSSPEPVAGAPGNAQYVASEAQEATPRWGLWIWRTVLALGGFALILALSRKAGRDRWEMIANTGRTRLGGSILWGIVSLLALPLLLVLLPGLTWALFGTPLALAVFGFLAVSWFLCWFLSPIVSGRNLASYLQPTLPGEQSTYVGELLGVLLIVLVLRLGNMPETDIPGFGAVLSLLAGLVVTVSYVLAVGGWIQSKMQPQAGPGDSEAMPLATNPS